MKLRRLGALVVLLGAAFALLIGSGALDVRVIWRGNDAVAGDWFGRSEPAQGAAPAAKPFWKTQEAAAEATAPHGAPQSFADLAERVSLGVVNIQTSKTVTGGSRPQAVAEATEIWNPTHFSRRIVPQLREGGASEAQIEALLEANPRRFFAGEPLPAR